MATDPAGDLGRKLDNIQRFIEMEMEQLAAEIEADAREKGEVERGGNKWQRDTGSARASTTAYAIHRDDHDHNYGDPDWQTARRIGSQKYWGGPLNYQPVEQQISLEEGPGVVLTMFVGYAPDIAGDILMQDMSAAWAGRFVDVVARAIGKALG